MKSTLLILMSFIFGYRSRDCLQSGIEGDIPQVKDKVRWLLLTILDIIGILIIFY